MTIGLFSGLIRNIFLKLNFFKGGEVTDLNVTSILKSLLESSSVFFDCKDNKICQSRL